MDRTLEAALAFVDLLVAVCPTEPKQVGTVFAKNNGFDVLAKTILYYTYELEDIIMKIAKIDLTLAEYAPEALDPFGRALGETGATKKLLHAMARYLKQPKH